MGDNMLKYLCAALFGFFCSAIHADLNDGRQAWQAIRSTLDKKLADIETRKQAAVKPINDEIDKVTIEREACKTFDCAKQADTKLRSLGDQWGTAVAPFANEADRETELAVTDGRRWALNSFEAELPNYVLNVMKADLRSYSVSKVCVNSRGGTLNKQSVCSSMTLEYRLGKTFYRTKLNFGISVQSPASGLAGLDILFKRPLTQFMEDTTPANGESSLNWAIMYPGGYQSYTWGVAGNRNEFGFTNVNRIGFESASVETTP